MKFLLKLCQSLKDKCWFLNFKCFFQLVTWTWGNCDIKINIKREQHSIFIICNWHFFHWFSFWLIQTLKTDNWMLKFQKSFMSSLVKFFVCMYLRTIQNNWPEYLWEKLDKRKWSLHAERNFLKFLPFLRWKKKLLHEWELFMFLFIFYLKVSNVKRN